MPEQQPTNTTFMEHLPPDHSVYLTAAGEEFAARDPELLTELLDSAVELGTDYPNSRDGFDWIDGGTTAHVYGIEGNDDYCVKIVNQKTMKAAWLGNRDVPLPNLLTEANFMDTIRQRLMRNSDSSVTSPAQYGVVSFPNGWATLQERIPSEFSTIRKLAKEFESSGICPLQQAEIALQRTKSALGKTGLRLATGDLRGTGGLVNSGNFLIRDDQLADESPIYAIDLLSAKTFSHLAARALLRFTK